MTSRRGGLASSSLGPIEQCTAMPLNRRGKLNPYNFVEVLETYNNVGPIQQISVIGNRNLKQIRCKRL